MTTQAGCLNSKNAPRRMLKKAVQQGRSKGRGEAYGSIRRASERRENEAGGLFQHPVKLAYTNGWISDETGWLAMLEDRNRTAHT